MPGGAETTGSLTVGLVVKDLSLIVAGETLTIAKLVVSGKGVHTMSLD